MTALYDELTTGPLAEQIAPLIAAGDDEGIAVLLNTRDISAPGNLAVHDIKKYISLIGLRLPILDSQADSCRQFNLALEDFKESGFDLGDPMIAGKVGQVLDALVAETSVTNFTEEHKATILSLANKQISRAEQLGIRADQSTVSKALRGS